LFHVFAPNPCGGKRTKLGPPSDELGQPRRLIDVKHEGSGICATDSRKKKVVESDEKRSWPTVSCGRMNGKSRERRQQGRARIRRVIDGDEVVFWR
jgi:hypothetical protein